MKKTIYHISALLTMCLMMLSSITFTSCSSDDDLSTDQYGNEISLNTWGPCPVLRGGTLRFLGSNLDQITAVRIPGVEDITAIDIKASGKVSEIWIQVPKENCTEGIVTLITAKGGEIKSITPITYQQDIKLEKVYVGNENNLQGSAGDVVTFKGDYLNLMHSVIFADDIKVTEDKFISHDRYTITVAIPKEAKSGKPILSDENPDGENYLYANEAISVNLPTATAVTPAIVKAGAVITVTGTDLKLINTIDLQGASIDSANITRAEDGKSLSFNLPAEATDGEVTLNTYSGVKIEAGSIETIIPTALSATPTIIKNGETITINGKDLDLITTISFPNAGEGNIASQSTTAITAIVPVTAQAGDITLSLANGKSVMVPYKLIEPTVTSFTPSSIMAGNKIIIKGTDLDLVAAITFPTDQKVDAADFTAQTSNAIGLTIPAAANGSGVILTLKNGTNVAASGLTISPSTDPTLSNSPSGYAGDEVTLEGKNYNNVEAVYVGATKVTKYASRTATSMTITIPNVADGTYDLIMHTTDGNKYTVGKIIILPKELVISNGNCVNQSDQSIPMTFPLQLSWDDSGRFRIQRNAPIDLTKYSWTAGKSLMKIYKVASSTGQAQINDGNWSSFTTASDWSGGQEIIEVQLTQGMIDWITGTSSDGWSNSAFIIQGDGLVVNKITLVP